MAKILIRRGISIDLGDGEIRRKNRNGGPSPAVFVEMDCWSSPAMTVEIDSPKSSAASGVVPDQVGGRAPEGMASLVVEE
jgi:hypothetical protein